MFFTPKQYQQQLQTVEYATLIRLKASCDMSNNHPNHTC